MMKIKVSWAFIILSAFWACNNDDDILKRDTVSITDNVWELVSKIENNQESTYPVTIMGDFDNDATVETLSRNDFYIFDEGWAFRAYLYVVVSDEGTDVTTLKSRSEQLFSGAASPYTLTNDSIYIFLKDYTVNLSDSELILQSNDHQLIFSKVENIEKGMVKNAPLEPENNRTIISGTWRMKYETGFEAKPDVYMHMPIPMTGRT